MYTRIAVNIMAVNIIAVNIIAVNIIAVNIPTLRIFPRHRMCAGCHLNCFLFNKFDF